MDFSSFSESKIFRENLVFACKIDRNPGLCDWVYAAVVECCLMPRPYNFHKVFLETPHRVTNHHIKLIHIFSTSYPDIKVIF